MKNDPANPRGMHAIISYFVWPLPGAFVENPNSILLCLFICVV